MGIEKKVFVAHTPFIHSFVRPLPPTTMASAWRAGARWVAISRTGVKAEEVRRRHCKTPPLAPPPHRARPHRAPSATACLFLLALTTTLPSFAAAVASVTVDRNANVLARSDFAAPNATALVPPPADPSTVKLVVVVGGAPHNVTDATVVDAVARGAGVAPASVTVERAPNPALCADVCGTWRVRVKYGGGSGEDAAAAAKAATLRVSLDSGANRSILHRLLVATRAQAATYNYVDGLVDGDMGVDVVTELGGARGGLAPAVVAGVVVGSVVGVVGLAVAAACVVVRVRRGRGWEEQAGGTQA